jgi:hypothetical protein
MLDAFRIRAAAGPAGGQGARRDHLPRYSWCPSEPGCLSTGQRFALLSSIVPLLLAPFLEEMAGGADGSPHAAKKE